MRLGIGWVRPVAFIVSVAIWLGGWAATLWLAYQIAEPLRDEHRFVGWPVFVLFVAAAIVIGLWGWFSVKVRELIIDTFDPLMFPEQNNHR